MLGRSHLEFEAVLAAARESTNRFDFALVAMLGLLGLLGLRISEASDADVEDLGEEHGHRVLLVHGKGSKQTLVPLPPAVGRALDQAVGDRLTGPILLNRRDRRMNRHCATRRPHNLARTGIVRLPQLHPYLLRRTLAGHPAGGGAGSDAFGPSASPATPTTPAGHHGQPTPPRRRVRLR